MSNPLNGIRRMMDAMSNSRVRNYVIPGLTSELVGGPEHGQVRLFTSCRETREFVTPHSHRFNFSCLILRGWVENSLFVQGSGDEYALGTVRPVHGGMGEYDTRRNGETLRFQAERTTYGEGECYSMRANEIHSIRFSRDAEVLFFEGPTVEEYSMFLEPVCDGKRVHTFEVRPWMFQRDE